MVFVYLYRSQSGNDSLTITPIGFFLGQSHKHSYFQLTLRRYDRIAVVQTRRTCCNVAKSERFGTVFV